MILSMLFVQGQQTHVHTYSHGTDHVGHIHYDMAHSVFNFSQQPHADEVAQISQAHSGLISKITFAPLLAIILVSLLLVVANRSIVHFARRQLFQPIYQQLDIQFRPPLRAPPVA